MAEGKQAAGALKTQIGGDHYMKLQIQPVEYIHANNIPFIEGCIIKYATRWRDKGGLKDLEKIKHFVNLLIELEDKKEGKKAPSRQDFPGHQDWETGEARMTAIGQNGNTGEHYPETQDQTKGGQ